MPKRSCPACERRLPYAGRRCVHCGWNARQSEPVSPGPRRGRFVVAVLVAAGLLMAGYAYRNAAALADWYAAFAAQNLPAGASSLAPARTSTGAFFFCARQVSRRMDGEFSVETFASEQQSRTEPLGDGRFRVESWVDEARQDGSHVRVDFVCTARFTAGRWALEELKLGDMAGR